MQLAIIYLKKNHLMGGKHAITSVQLENIYIKIKYVDHFVIILLTKKNQSIMMIYALAHVVILIMNISM